MIKGFIDYKGDKIAFVIDDYRMELFADDTILVQFCKECNFKKNYILNGQCYDSGISNRKATFLVEYSIERQPFW